MFRNMNISQKEYVEQKQTQKYKVYGCIYKKARQN